MKKRVALVLALVMVLSVFSMSASALTLTSNVVPNRVGETTGAQAWPGSGNDASIVFGWSRNDLGNAEDIISVGNGIFEMKVELDNAEVWNLQSSFDFNFAGGDDGRARILGVYDEDGNNMGNPANPVDVAAREQIDSFRVLFQIDPPAVNDGTLTGTVARFALRLQDVIVTEDEGNVEAIISAEHRAPAVGSDVAGMSPLAMATVRENSRQMFGGWAERRVNLWGIASGVRVWVDPIKYISAGALWNDVGDLWFEEHVANAWAPGDRIQLELPRGFHWDQNAATAIVVDDDTRARTLNLIGNPRDLNAVIRVRADRGAGTHYRVDANIGQASKRVAEITLPAGVVDPTEFSRFAIRGLRIMADRRTADAGDVVVRVSSNAGGPNFDVNELTIARYGDKVVDIYRFEEEPATVWSGHFVELSRLVIEESMWEAIPRNATIELTLPEGVKWREPQRQVSNYLDINNDHEPRIDGDESSLRNLRFMGLQQDGAGVNNILTPHMNQDLAWYIVDNNRQTVAATISQTSTANPVNIGGATLNDGGTRVGAKIVLENLEVAVESQYQYEDIPVQVKVAGWEQEVVLGHAVPKVEAEMSEMAEVQLGLRDQPIGDILITEYRAGAVGRAARGQMANIITLQLEGVALARHKFTRTPTAEVLFEGDARDALQIERVWMSPDRDQINIQVKDFSVGNASSILISDLVLTLDRTAPEGPIEIFIGGQELVDQGTALQAYFMDSTWLHRFDLASVITPADRTKVPEQAVFTVGQASYTLGGRTVAMDATPFIAPPGRVMLPARFVANALGIDDDQIQWNQETQTVSVFVDNWTAQMTVGETTAHGRQSLQMDAAPVNVDGRVYVPMRFLANLLGVDNSDITWNEAAQSVTFY